MFNLCIDKDLFLHNTAEFQMTKSEDKNGSSFIIRVNMRCRYYTAAVRTVLPPPPPPAESTTAQHLLLEPL